MVEKVSKLKKFLVVAVCALVCIASVGTADAYAYTRKCPRSPFRAKTHKWYAPDDQPGRATCFRNGSRVDMCAYCGQTRRIFERATKKHIFEDSPRVAIKKSTCTKGGKYKVYCHSYSKGCRAYRIERTAPLGHTCTTYNHQTYKGICSRCGKIYKLNYKQRKYVDAMLNNFTDGSFSSK